MQKRFNTGDDENKKECFKVKDQCHYTGKYRGTARDICNLRYKMAKKKFL